MIKSWFEKIDWLLFFLIASILAIGILSLDSVTGPMLRLGKGNPYIKQLFIAVLGIIVMFFVANISTKLLYRIAWPAYLASLFLLLLVLVLGKTGLGATRWLGIGGFQFQPSEFAKVSVLLGMARFLSETKDNINSVKVFFLSGLIVSIPWLLIVVEPDLGTSLVFLAFFFPVLYWAGFRMSTIVLMVFPVAALISTSNTFALIIVFSLLIFFLLFQKYSFKFRLLILLINIGFALAANPVWNSLKPYQQKRILTFLDPSVDPRGAGYQVIQSMVTIGSGGIYGQGFQSGSQTQLGFIPEQHTDFIFTVIGEEFGFIGITITLLLFLFAIWRIVWIAKTAKTSFAGTVSIGIATILSFHLLVNVGMTLGAMPVTGLPLPFLSFGRSSLMAFCIFIGICLNFYKNRLEY